MNFYSILMDCYQKNINPFVLYSMMNDICKSDLKLKKEVGYFYEIHNYGLTCAFSFLIYIISIE